ncbi:anti-sigma factor family protein [Zavarzinia sp. CC-PAN008]|uniref:anti-sigma factor family protein n=1 Tax=Zavarzinia sp. CC-PAN008 TaxID=3243332 RepID=UPI003F749B06
MEQAFSVMAADGPIDEDDVQDYIEGRADPARASAIKAWLARDPQRRQEVEALVAQRDALRAIGAGVLDEPVPARLLDILRPGGGD